MTRPMEVGIGFRPPHSEELLAQTLAPSSSPSFSPSPYSACSWLEILVDNFLTPGGSSLQRLKSFGERYPLAFHSVGMNLASPEKNDFSYLKKLKELGKALSPPWYSDHLCLSALGGHYFHDLLPFPYNEEHLKQVSKKVQEIQDFLEAPLLIENISSYTDFESSTFGEGSFLKDLCQETGSFLLLDLNNIYVNARNRNLDPWSVVLEYPLDRVRSLHLAGHETYEEILLDTHGSSITQEVWDLYAQFLHHHQSLFPLLPLAPTLIEWDHHLPSLENLLQEAQRAKKIYEKFQRS